MVGAPAELGFATMAYRRCPQVTSLSWPWTRLEGGASVTASASTSSASKASASSASASASTASASKAPASNAPASKTVTSEASSSEASAPTSLGSRQSATGKSKPAAEHSPRATSATRHLDQSAELDTATQAPGAPGVYQGAARLEAAAVLGDGLWRAGAAAPGERVQAGATPVSGEIGDDGKSKVPRAGEPRVSRGRVRGGASSGGGGSRQTTPDTEKETVLLSDNPDAILLSSNPGVPPWLPPSPPVARPRATHNAAMLAYVGDSIYEMYARWHFLNPPVAIPGYCQRVMSVVCCEAQVSTHLCVFLRSQFPQTVSASQWFVCWATQTTDTVSSVPTSSVSFVPSMLSVPSVSSVPSELPVSFVPCRSRASGSSPAAHPEGRLFHPRGAGHPEVGQERNNRGQAGQGKGRDLCIRQCHGPGDPGETLNCTFFLCSSRTNNLVNLSIVLHPSVPIRFAAFVILYLCRV